MIDSAVNATAAAVLRLARSCARFDERVVDRAVESFASQVRRLGELARSPQTGQLHEYYLEALLVLAAGVVLLVMVR